MIPIYPLKPRQPPVHISPSAGSVVDVYLQPGRIHLSALPPLTLYVHFPWCIRKCPYCDFNSHEQAGGIEQIPEMRYLDALRDDLEHALPLIWGRRVHAVFIGGGTPSLLSAAGLDRLLADVRTLLPLEPDAEITLEANPGTFESDKFASYRASGVNRLSIGIQSFNPMHLQALGRVHDGEQARRAVEIAHRHFDNFNLDLMYALPQQLHDEAMEDVETALSFAPPHLSLYHLTLEPNTLFAKYPPPLPDDDQAANMQDAIEARMQAAAYQHYEVSAYAQKGKASRHNLNYWNFGDYLGIGAGAHSKLSFPHRVIRQMRFKQPRDYLSSAPDQKIQEEHEVSRDELPFEFMLNLLRLKEGFACTLFGERTGLSLNTIEKSLMEAERRGLIERDPFSIQPTALGLRYLNDLQGLFLPA